MRTLAILVAWSASTVGLVLAGWPAKNYRDFDFIGTWLAARGVLQGTDFYDPAVFRELFVQQGSQGYAYIPGTGSGYAMPAALLAVPFGALPFEIAAPLWLTTQVALVVLGLLALARALFPMTFRRDAVLLLGLACALQPLWVSLYTGQAGGFVLGITAHATALLVSARPMQAGIALGLNVLKPHLFLWSIPLLLLTSRRRVTLLAGMLASGGTLLAISFLIRPDWPFAWLRSAGTLQGMNVSRANAWGLAPEDARWLGWIVVALAVSAFLAWWRSRPPQHVVWAGAIAVSLLAAPYSWSYDYGLLAIPAAVIMAAVAQSSARVRAAVLLALTAVWVVLPWILYLEAHRTGAESTAAFVPAALLGLLIAVGHGAWASAGRESGPPRGG